MEWKELDLKIEDKAISCIDDALTLLWEAKAAIGADHKLHRTIGYLIDRVREEQGQVLLGLHEANRKILMSK